MGRHFWNLSDNKKNWKKIKQQVIVENQEKLEQNI